VADPRLSQWAPIRLPWPRFRRPPYDPGRRGFPSPVLTWALRTTPSQRMCCAPADPEHAPHSAGLLRPSFLLRRSGPPAQSPEPLPEPPSAQSPFARLGHYLRQEGVEHPLDRHYPAVRATTGSCASPHPSRRLGLEALGGPSLPVAVSPGWDEHLPDVISAIRVSSRLDPNPAAFLRCLPVSSRRTAASP
jgi:hypothetical protein